MAAPAATLRPERKERREKRPRLAYYVEALPGRDEARGAEIAVKWLRERLTG